MQFFNKARKIPILKNSTLEKQESITDDLDKITMVFDNVANILSHVEAKELFPKVIGSSASMRNIFTQIMKVAPTDSTVFITGESGTGKELIAASIYEHSARKEKPFIKINCVAIPEGLLESELFGHERGSFTGAIAQKKGKFEIADGGTLFLDEIGDMPLATQAKILRVLQEKEFERVGGTKPIRVDVRFIAATNKTLPRMIKDGLFREDLYFRLNVFSIFLPALRERIEDIPLLANFFLSNFKKEVKLTSAVLQLLIGYSWPGNIRELKNVLEQASVLADKDFIEPHHLPDVINRQGLIAIADNLNGDIVALDDKLMIMEKEMIINALKMTGGIQVKAANILGINQRSLWHRIKKLDIDINSVRNLQ
jgi:transcriptional regulator with PAS, ATPase and Fis domain